MEWRCCYLSRLLVDVFFRSPSLSSIIVMMKIVSVLLVAVLLSMTALAFPKAIIHMEGFGDLEITLRPDAAPLTVQNFERLARSGFYNHSCEFYRHSPGFVLQGGNLFDTSNQTVPLEYNLPNKKYSVGLARAAAPNTGSSEFFINLANNTAVLAPNNQSLGYAVFGELSGGFAALEKMLKVPVIVNTTIGFHMPNPPPKMRFIEIKGGPSMKP